MFNEGLKAKLNALAGQLSEYLREHPDGEQQEASAVSYRSAGENDVGSWWPAQLGHPSAMGAQDQMRYATFPDKRRLVIDDHGKIEIYDTGEHRISGASQSQSMDSTLGFVSQHGVVRVSDLTRVDATCVLSHCMETVTIVGYLATICSMTSFTPQAWKIIKTRDTTGISVPMYASPCLGSPCGWLSGS